MGLLFHMYFLFHNKINPGWLSTIQGMHQPWTQCPSSQEAETSSFILLLAQPKQPCKIPAVSWGTFLLAFPTFD